jgi:hypothetical protein
MTQDIDRHGIVGVAEADEWLKGLVRAVWKEAVPPKDARVKSLWDLLRQRQLLGRSPWLREVLRRIWDQGLAARVRPRTARRLVRRLRRWGILPPGAVAPGIGPISTAVQAGGPARLVPLRPIVALPPGLRRPIFVRPVQPVAVRPVARPVGRR